MNCVILCMLIVWMIMCGQYVENTGHDLKTSSRTGPYDGFWCSAEQMAGLRKSMGAMNNCTQPIPAPKDPDTTRDLESCCYLYIKYCSHHLVFKDNCPEDDKQNGSHYRRDYKKLSDECKAKGVTVAGDVCAKASKITVTNECQQYIECNADTTYVEKVWPTTASTPGNDIKIEVDYHPGQTDPPLPAPVAHGSHTTTVHAFTISLMIPMVALIIIRFIVFI